MEMDDFLKSIGINTNGVKYDDMSRAERDTVHMWLDALKKSELTIEKVKEYIHQMRDAVEIELTKTGLGKDEDIFLKARLRNYMMLEAFLLTPEKAKKALENQLSNVKK